MSRLLRLLCCVCAFSVIAGALTTSAAGQSNSGNNAGRSRLARPKGEPLRVQDVSPQLKQVLTEWYRNTSTIKTLEGQHSKYVYDFTFNVEKRATGKFYYEAPDKGRIDIEPAEIRPGEKAQRVGPNKKPFALQADRAEQWLSTGKTIYQIDPVNKKAIRYAIPPQAQGKNIMDGPLPFLLGMPPQKALQRYKLKIMRDDEGRLRNYESEVWLQVRPKWKSDAANYREANVILQKTNHYLPRAVKLIDPSGHQETVYTFYNTIVNKKQILASIFGKNPFNIDLREYKIENAIPKSRSGNRSAQQAQNRSGKRPGAKSQAGRARITENGNASGRPVPDLRGVHFKDAEKRLKELGFRVEFRKGSVAAKQQLLYRVQSQSPKPNSRASQGKTIVLRLFVKRSDLKRTAAKQ